jgi:glycosyltransferase involved in cell wall biosynthesis
MRVLFLYSGVRGALIEKARQGGDPGGGTWGLLPLRKLGVTADVVELEQWFSTKTAQRIRSMLGVYNSHLPFFFRFFSYDIVFTAGAFGSQLALTFIKSVFRIRRPLWVMHDFSIIGLLGGEETLRQKLFRYLVSRADGIVTLGLKEAEELQRRFPHLQSRIAFIPFGVDISFFRPQQIPEEKLVIAVGVDPDRDWPTFFAATKGLDAKVLVAGSPHRAKQFNPPPHVEVKFFQPKEMVELYAKASVVVLPLNTSGRNNDAMGCSTLYEAMAMGKALVVSRTDHMESYVSHGENGVLIPQKDAEAMRGAIVSFLGNSEFRTACGRAARAYATEHLDMTHCAMKLRTFFERVHSSSLY